MAALDSKKAFDTEEQDSIWKTLSQQGVPTCYINLLEGMYANQEARGRADRTRKTFRITRGTKQGDLLSSLLFNALLEDVFQELAVAQVAMGHPVRAYEGLDID